MRRLITHILLFGMLIMGVRVVAQPPAKKPQGGLIKGVVMDAALKIPVEYATVSVFHEADSSLVNGTITSAKGMFQIEKLRPGKYYLEVSFIGYIKKRIGDIRIGKGQRVVDLKAIFLKQASEALGEVVVTSERAPVQYKIDKKVVPVSNHHTAASGTAVDVLENVPSVNVDIQGNVSLRGSSGFTVLIDGRPTVLESNDALEQMPASVIDNIEIITNPSAKYDPEGTAGIINIITKKGKLKGMSGLVNVNAGLYDNYGGDFLWNYRKKKFSVYIGADYNKRSFPGTQENENRTLVDGNTNYVLSKGDMDRNMTRYGVRGGFDLQMDSSNLISMGIRYGGRSMQMGSLLDYEEYTNTEGEHSYYNSDQSWKREMDFISGNLNYQHNFSKEGHKLVGELIYSYRDGDENSVNQLTDSQEQITSGKRSVEKGPGSRLRWKLDYSLPLKGENRFEAGYQGRCRSSDDINELYNYDTDLEQYVYQPRYSHSVTYKGQVHSLYSLYAAENGAFGYQLGIRGEYTNREIVLVEDESRFTLDRWDFFPTIHTTYHFNDDNQIMASYTRRVQRPRSWYLEPFITWTDAYNVRRGNPDLKPEFIDSYELGYLKHIGQHMISLEGYYRMTHNKVERVRSVYEENVMLSTMANVGKDYSLGAELMFSLAVARWWKSDIIGNLYHYKEEGELFGKDFSQESLNWSLRNNNTFKIDQNTRLQLTLSYNSPTDWAQGRREGYLTTNAALRKDFLKRRLSATLQVRDIFGTSKYESTYAGADFYSYSLIKHNTPIVRLNVSFKINNYKTDKKKGGREGLEEEGFEM